MGLPAPADGTTPATTPPLQLAAAPSAAAALTTGAAAATAAKEERGQESAPKEEEEEAEEAAPLDPRVEKLVSRLTRLAAGRGVPLGSKEKQTLCSLAAGPANTSRAARVALMTALLQVAPPPVPPHA